MRLLRSHDGGPFRLSFARNRRKALGLGSPNHLSLLGCFPSCALYRLLRLPLCSLHLTQRLFGCGFIHAAANLFTRFGSRSRKIAILCSAHIGPGKEGCDVLR